MGLQSSQKKVKYGLDILFDTINIRRRSDKMLI
jgi:hypothetical protein